MVDTYFSMHRDHQRTADAFSAAERPTVPFGVSFKKPKFTAQRDAQHCTCKSWTKTGQVGLPRATAWGRRVDLAVVCPEGIEPPTHSLEGCCSIQLSYGQRSKIE